MCFLWSRCCCHTSSSQRQSTCHCLRKPGDQLCYFNLSIDPKCNSQILEILMNGGVENITDYQFLLIMNTLIDCRTSWKYKYQNRFQVVVNENKIVKEKAKATTEGSYKATRSKEGSTKSPLVTGSPPNSHSVKPNACKNIGCLSKLCANGQDEKKNLTGTKRRLLLQTLNVCWANPQSQHNFHSQDRITRTLLVIWALA